MPENLRGTSTSSDYNSARTSSFAIFLYKSCTIANFEHLGYLPLLNYVCIVASRPGSQRALSFSETAFLPYYTTVKLLPLYNACNSVIQALEPYYDAWELSLALCLLSYDKFIQGCHPNWYLQPERLLVLASAKQPHNHYSVTLVYL